MRIKEFKVDRYGHIGFENRFVLKNFTLFWGKNEVGKTLTLEAIIKFLLGKYSRIFQNINRVNENPSGYLVIESSNGNIKLPDNKSLVDILGVDASIFRNVFIIRNSDLSIENEAGFFKDITDRLTGLNLQRIKEVKGTLLALGHLTENFNIKDDQSSGKLASRIGEAKKLVDEIENFLVEAYERKYDEIEKLIVSLEEEKSKLQESVSIYQDAEKRRKYEEGLKIKNDYEKRLELLKALEPINRETERKLQQANTTIDNHLKNIKDRREKLEDLKKIESKYRAELSELELEYELLRKKKSKIENTIAKINKYKEESEELAGKKGIRLVSKYSIYCAGIAVFLAILFAFLKTTIISGVFGVIFIISFLFGVINILSIKKKEGKLASLFENIKNELTPLELEAENISDIDRNIQKFMDEVEKFEMMINKKKNEVELCEKQISSIGVEIGDLNKRIKDLEDSIKENLFMAKVSSIDEYSDKLEEKGKLEAELSRLESEFYRVFELGEKIGFESWDRILKEYEPFKERALNVEYIPGKVDEIRSRINEIEIELENLMKGKDEYVRRFHRFEERANEVLRLEEPIRIDSLSQVEKLKDKISEFLSFYDQLHDNCGIAIQILEEIENEKRQGIRELFDEGSKAVEYFKNFSEGRYKAISYDLERNSLYVVGKDDVEIPVENLSAGAYDQLYLAIRLSLAESILMNEAGFFLMDDPFIKSDPDRLDRELEIPYNLAQSGWQIIYFSAKEEIRERIKKLHRLDNSLVEIYILDEKNKANLHEESSSLLF